MRRQLLATIALLAVTWMAASAQEKPKPAPAPDQPSPAGISGRIPLKVQFVLSRYQGDKRVSSMPYILGVLSNGQKTSLRMGTQVPMSTTMSKEFNQVPSYQYKDLGTNIDCQANDTGSGQYSLVVTISDSSLLLDSSAEKQQQRIVRDVPAFRSFSTSFAMLLRDGQTMQYASATDPISGEVLKIDVTLSLAK